MEKLFLSNIELEELSAAITADVLEKLLPVILAEIKKETSPIYIKPRQAGELISMSGSFVRKLVHKGELTGYFPGSDLRIKRSELIKYMESRGTKIKR